MEKSPLFHSYFCHLTSILPYFFAIRFICPSHRHSPYCTLPTVRLIYSSVIRIGSSFFTDSGYSTTEERSRIYRIYSLQRDFLMGQIWPISFTSDFNPSFRETENMCSDNKSDFIIKFYFIWQHGSKKSPYQNCRNVRFLFLFDRDIAASVTSIP